MDIRDKVVVITGASSGIGLATARLLARHGAKVALAARSRDRLNQLAAELPSSFSIPTDMTSQEDIRNMVGEVLKHFGRVDILINNAGRGYDAPLEQIDLDKYRQLFELDVVGPLIAMQLVIPTMRKQGGGMIVNISSGTSLMYLPNMSAYSSVKRALNSITLTAREELAKDNIIVSVVYPYMTLTDLDKNMFGVEGGDFEPEPFEGEADANLPPPDPPEYVATRILEVIETEEAEQYAHDWMRRLG
ncbi:MAG: SDR family oxidoreductase [Dehalococcoidia bacterium]|nr:SDR family oxidoreductase [Dehalococcoidia bacterium]